MTTSAPVRAAVYVRVSTAGQEEGTSLDTQEAACRAYCAERGYEATVYRETHTGADLFGRPQLSAVRDAVRRGEVGRVVAYALDRLTRNQAHLGLILSEAEHAGAAVELVTERLEDTPEGRLLQSVRGFVAEVERLKIAERTQRGRRARAEAGKPLPGWKPPYGYRWGDAGKTRLVPDEPEAAVVRRLFREAAAGTSLRRIAGGLAADGIASPTGLPHWTTATLHQILLLPTYSGRPRALRKVVGRSASGKRAQTLRPEADQVVLPSGVAPALVDPVEQDAVAARLARNRAEAPRRNADPEAMLLRAGFVRCGYCGHALAGHHDKRRGWAYDCPARNQGPDHRKARIMAPILDAAVWGRVQAVLTRPDVVAAAVERQREKDPAADDLAALDARLAAIDARRKRVARAVVALDDEDAASPLLAELTSLAGQRRTLDEERATLAARQAGREADRERLADLSAWCGRVAGNLPTLSYQERRDVLTALGVRVRVWRTDHDPRWEITVSPDGIVSTTPRQRTRAATRRPSPCRRWLWRRPSRRRTTPPSDRPPAGRAGRTGRTGR